MKYLLWLVIAGSLVSCSTSVSEYNKTNVKIFSPAELRKDVDYTYQQLQELHPELYMYISKPQLDFKFDSLKQSINAPMTRMQLYLKLQPVVSSVKEGHLMVLIPQRKLSKEQKKGYQSKTGLLSRFDYFVKGDQLFITKNKDSSLDIQPGTEVTKINNVAVNYMLAKYRRLVTSDGFNKTYYPYLLEDSFLTFFVFENGYVDEVKLETRYNNVPKTYVLKRTPKSVAAIKAEKEDSKTNTTKKVNAYESYTNSYNRQFKFLTEDKSVAYVKVKGFSKNYSEQFYKDTFEKIKNGKSKYLVLDVRDNLGGSMYEINELYSYLAQKPFTLIKPSVVASRSSAMQVNYFKNANFLVGFQKALLYPFFAMGQSSKTYKGKDGKYYYKMMEAKETKPKSDAFQGKIYLLINGRTFSAASIISAKLKGDKRALVIGEETGGANDGTVAGIFATKTLPNSRLNIPIGLVLVRPNIEFSNTKMGVMPDIPVFNSLETVIDGRDLQLERAQLEIDKDKAGF